jgi:hypothetical protein
VTLQLLVVSRPRESLRKSFEEVARLVEACDPGVRVRVIRDLPYRRRRLLMALRPTLVFSPLPLKRFRPLRGTVFQGVQRGKDWDLTRLAAAGIPIPRWTLLRGPDDPVPRDFGPYVVTKPNQGYRGNLVRIVRSDRVCWKPKHEARGGLLVQEFVYTGRWPRSTRVTTLFGEVLYAVESEASHARRPLESRFAFAGGEQGGGLSVVATARDCTMNLTEDPELLVLARRAAGAFPEVPLLGVDLVRDAETGRCCVLEVNPFGRTWHFASRPGLALQAAHGFDLAAQFDGLHVAARVLAAQTRLHAR